MPPAPPLTLTSPVKLSAVVASRIRPPPPLVADALVVDDRDEAT